MSKFKIGDKVKVVKHNTSIYGVGDEVFIFNINENNSHGQYFQVTEDILLKKEDFACNLRESEIELIEDTREKSILQTSKAYTIKLAGYRKDITESEAIQLRDELVAELGDK